MDEFKDVAPTLAVTRCHPQTASRLVIEHHYLHRKPPISRAFSLCLSGELKGVITFGVPASRHLQKSVCPSAPDYVLELNRLWVDDCLPRNTESWFVSRALSMLPARLICSYADTAQGHDGTVYKACNWHYAGYTDMDRKTPRFDYVVEGKHSRAAFRDKGAKVTKVRRKPKHKFWIATGDKRQKKILNRMCGWVQI